MQFPSVFWFFCDNKMACFVYKQPFYQDMLP